MAGWLASSRISASPIGGWKVVPRTQRPPISSAQRASPGKPITAEWTPSTATPGSRAAPPPPRRGGGAPSGPPPPPAGPPPPAADIHYHQPDAVEVLRR